MNIEQSLEYLISNAEFRIDKADTQKKADAANRFAEAVNNIIDVHNEIQDCYKHYEDAKKSLSFILHLIGVSDYDTDRIVTMDQKFLKYHLTKNIYVILKEREGKEEYKGVSEKWLFHNVVVAWDIYQDALRDLQFYRNMFDSMAEESKSRVMIAHEIVRLKLEIRNYTDYSCMEEMENYIKTC